MTDRLTELKEMSERWVAGLNVGTSHDGIDAALLRVAGFGFGVRFSLHTYRNDPLPSGMAEQLACADRLDAPAICDLHARLGAALAEAALTAARQGGLAPGELNLVGSHGVTLWHRPPRRPHERGATMQLGDLSVIAERTGCTVVGDFRAADVAAGGQGAPLMPYLDYVLFRDRPGTLLLNLGGVANLTYVGESVEKVIAFDTGPANLPLDATMRRLSGGEASFDADGRTAAMGHVDRILLDQLLALPYLHAPPPKSTGREEFGEPWLERLLERHHHLKLVDILATLTAFVARSVKVACEEWISPRPVQRVVVSGGGLHNLTLMSHLRRELDPVPVESLIEHGLDPDAKEGVLFGLLANDRIFARPTNVPAATGAMWPVSLGCVAF